MKKDLLIFEDNGLEIRIDKYLVMFYQDITRSLIQNMIEKEEVKVNDKKVKSNYILKDGDKIEVCFSDPTPSSIQAEDIPLDVLYEDEDIVVVNKASGMVVHPAVGNKSGTLVNALLHHCKDLSGINGETRPGIVHRIDKDTSGLLVVCKNDFSHNEMAKQFQNKEVNKIYYAICSGVIPHNVGVIDAPIGRDIQNRQQMAISDKGKDAVTHFKVLERYNNHTLIEVKLETGRTHQIRVHMKYIGYPVSGDPIYGYKKEISEFGQYLHAKKLGFNHPRTGKYNEIDSDLPEYFENFLKELEERKNSK